MLDESHNSERRNVWEYTIRKSPVFDTHRNSKVVPANSSMPELHSSTSMSQIQPRYTNHDNQIQPYSTNRNSQIQPSQSGGQPVWTMDSYPSNQYAPLQKKSTSLPRKNLIIKASVIGVIIGLCICGIPLGIITGLYLQPQSQTSSGSTGSTNLPAQCSAYSTISDSTRRATCTGSYYTDCSWTAGWYRITGGSGTRLSTMPVSSSYCCTSYPGWLNGTHPSTAGTTAFGMYCVVYSGYLCYPSWSTSSVLITNCDGFYVYYLPSIPSCNSRYCTAD